jgi:hypothetical protein
VDAAVALLCKSLIVCDNDKGLSEVTTQLEKEFLQFRTIF